MKSCIYDVNQSLSRFDMILNILSYYVQKLVLSIYFDLRCTVFNVWFPHIDCVRQSHVDSTHLALICNRLIFLICLGVCTSSFQYPSFQTIKNTKLKSSSLFWLLLYYSPSYICHSATAVLVFKTSSDGKRQRVSYILSIFR